MSSLKKIFLVCAILFLSNSVRAVNIDVMVLYTNEFASYNNPALFINNAINYSNQAFINSNMDIRFKVKHHQILELPGNSQVSAGLRDRVASAANVNDLRNTHRPDVVVYLTRMSSSLCGIAFFPDVTINPRNSADTELPTRTPNMAFKGVSIVGWDCPVDTFPHEIGHNLGAGHGPVDIEVFRALDGNITYTDRDHSGIPTNSRGHGVRDVFRTIMAYPDVFGNAPVLAFHSNPKIAYNGLPTGTTDRDNASGMQRIANQYVSGYSMCYPTQTFVMTDPRSGGATTQVCGSYDRYCAKFSDPVKVWVGRTFQYETHCIQYNMD